MIQLDLEGVITDLEAPIFTHSYYRRFKINKKTERPIINSDDCIIAQQKSSKTSDTFYYVY